MNQKIIVSHVSPDWDAICSLWLLQRFGGFEDAEIVLVNTGQPDPAVLARAAAVVDTGGEYDLSRWRFDHHTISDPNSTCATLQVFHWLRDQSDGTPADWAYLYPLTALIYAGDTGKPDAKQSHEVGIHALLSNRKAQGWPDMNLIGYGYSLLDDLAASLLRQHEARTTLDQFTVYRSADGLLVALDQSSRAAVQAAHDAGARLVLWHKTREHTETIELWHGGQGPDVDCRIVVLTACGNPTLPADALGELSSWYLHEAGFYAGRGSDKAPDARPLAAPVADIAAALDAAWIR